MKLRLLLFVIIPMFCITIFNAYSQLDENPLTPGEKGKPFYMGPVVGYNKVSHSVTMASFVDNTGLCNPFQDGSGNGFFAGLSFEYLFGELKQSNSSIIARVLYNSFPGDFTQAQDSYPALMKDPNDSTKNISIITSTQHLATVKYNVITFEAMYKLNPIKGVSLGVTAGLTFDFPISKTIHQTFNLLEPLNAYFPGPQTAQDSIDWPANGWKLSDDKRSIIVKDGPITNAASFRMGLKIGLQYEILTASSMYIVPGIFYNIGLTNVTSDESWKIHALQIGLDVRWAINIFN